MQTLAGLALAVIAAAYLSAVAQGRGREWLHSKFIGTPPTGAGHDHDHG